MYIAFLFLFLSAATAAEPPAFGAYTWPLRAPEGYFSAKKSLKRASDLFGADWRLGENYDLKNRFIFRDWEPIHPNLILSVSVSEYIDLLAI